MKKFKTESEKIMQMMINSIYTNKEIFIRELISNASDALDKLYYKNLVDKLDLQKDSFVIRLSTNKDDKTLIIEDNGIGMDKDELEENLGVIAHSGTLDFKNSSESKEDISVIGQFGVGFYSAFMVAKKVVVESKKYGSEQSYVWSSSGVEGYDIKEGSRENYGTKITVYLKDDEEDEKYSDYLDEYTLRNLVTKYSDYIRYPIKTLVAKEIKDEEDGEKTHTEYEEETLNSMIPLWKKNKNEIKEEEYKEFYKNSFFGFDDPVLTIHYKAEGIVNFTALLFIPSKAPYNYYHKSFEKGLKLYSNNVLISEKTKELLPDYYSFISGVIDCDLALNVSRETIQHSAELRKIARNLESKIKSELLSLLEKDRAKYEAFYQEFGMQLSFGVYNDYGINKDKLIDLLLYKSVINDKYLTLKEYVAAKKENQKYIYYANSKSVSLVKNNPQAGKLLDENLDILLFDKDVDEFAIRVIRVYEELEFKSISDASLDEDASSQKGEDMELVTLMKEYLGDKVSDVRVSNKLKNFPISFATIGDISIEMEKTLAQMPNNNGVKAQKVLEINANHQIYHKLQALTKDDKETLKKYTSILYQQARLNEGLSVDDPKELSENIIDLLSK